MLELKSECEKCGVDLPHDSDIAMICSFECTFCSDCVANVFKHICPNCGGNLERRPKRIASSPGQ